MISASASERPTMSSSAPWTVSSGWYGWRPAKPGRRHASSLMRGLYFIVQLPSGYIPESTPKFIDARCA